MLRVGHSIHERCADCGTPLGDRNALAIDELHASWCVACVERLVVRCREGDELNHEERLDWLEAAVGELRAMAAEAMNRLGAVSGN